MQLPHKYKIVIAGNHELCFDPSLASNSDRVGRAGHIGSSPANLNTKLQQEGEDQQPTDSVSCDEIKKELTNCTYLEDSFVEICGLKIYGKFSLRSQTSTEPEAGAGLKREKNYLFCGLSSLQCQVNEVI